MQKLWRFITSFFLFFTLILAAFEIYRCGIYVFNSVKIGNHQGYMWLLIGMAAFFIASKTFFKKNLEFMQTMTHETAHLLIAVLLFRRKIAEFNAKSIDWIREGENLGEVWSEGSHNIILSLAPYMLPYISLLFLFIRLMIKNECLPIIDFIIGFSLMHHILCWKKDISSEQTDISSSGILRSYLYIWTFILFNFAIIFYSLGGGSQAPLNIIQANAKWFSQALIDIKSLFHLIAK